MRHLADKRYSNLWDGSSDSKCMTEHSGSCVKELEILRHFQTWSCLYKAWSRSRSRERGEEEENEKRFEWENIRESRKKKRVLSTSLCRQL